MSVFDGEEWFGAERVPSVVPSVVFKTRQLGDWVDVNSYEIFGGRRVVVFALPGAFTPTCSSKQLPGYEELYDDFLNSGVDEVFCLSVNDSFTMNAWAESLGISKVKMIPDGSGSFTRRMNMSVDKDNLGFGQRSWRYAMVVDNGRIEKLFEEPNKRDKADSDPYELSTPENVLAYLQGSTEDIPF